MLIQTDAEFWDCIEHISEANTIALDTETTWTDNWIERRLLGIALYIPPCITFTAESYYLPFRHEHNNDLFVSHNLPLEYLTKLDEMFARKDLSFIFHNAKFDLQVLKRAGINVQNKFYCTMVMSHMLDENSRHDLDWLTNHHFGEDAGGKEKRIKKVQDACGGWEKIPPIAMAKYAERDTELTYMLFNKLFPQLEEQELLHLWKGEMEFCRLLAEIEHTGIAVDRDRIKELNEAALLEMDRIKDHLGIDPMKPAQLANMLFRTLGLPYPMEIGKATKQFPKGRPSMAENVLLRYKCPEVNLVLKYRGFLKATLMWLKPFLEYADTDGRMHPNFNQHGTITTRLSSNSPNMQQIPRDEKSSPIPVKKILTAASGFQLWSFDYSQIELRLAATYAQEESMLITLREGGDIHQLTANLCDIDRHSGKTLNFAMLYGAGSGKIAELLKISWDEARGILATFHAAYPRLKAMADKTNMIASERMWIRYWNGRRRHFIEDWETHKAFNSLIQGGAAQILHESGRKLYKEYEDSASRIVCFVHDDIWIEIPEHSATQEVFRIKTVLETWPTQKFKLPFPVEYKRLGVTHV